LNELTSFLLVLGRLELGLEPEPPQVRAEERTLGGERRLLSRQP